MPSGRPNPEKEGHRREPLARLCCCLGAASPALAQSCCHLLPPAPSPGRPSSALGWLQNIPGKGSAEPEWGHTELMRQDYYSLRELAKGKDYFKVKLYKIYNSIKQKLKSYSKLIAFAIDYYYLCFELFKIIFCMVNHYMIAHFFCIWTCYMVA